MFWRVFYKLKGVKGLNEAIENRNIKDITNFLKVYLDRPFDLMTPECFKIFFFLDDYVKNKEDYALCESLMINSKYFATIPEEKVVEALKMFSFLKIRDFNTEKFSKYLIAKITNPDILLNSDINDIVILFLSYYGLGIENIILELGAQYVTLLSKKLSFENSKKILTYYKPFYIFSDEFMILCQKGDFRIEDISDVVLKNYDSLEFDILFDIIINKKTELTSPFLDFLKVINSRQEITPKHKNYLAIKLLETKKIPRMLDWLANIECPMNKKLIDELVGKVPDFTLLYLIASKSDISYAISRILEQGNMNKFGFQTGDSLFMDDYDTIEKLNLVLDTLYDVEPNIKFSKDLVINFLKNGVNKFPLLINEYELTEEERLEVLEALRESNSDWLIIYGNYLAIGNNISRTKEDVANKQMKRIRNLKSM